MQETFFVETLLGKADREPSLLAQNRLSLPGQVSWLAVHCWTDAFPPRPSEQWR